MELPAVLMGFDEQFESKKTVPSYRNLKLHKTEKSQL